MVTGVGRGLVVAVAGGFLVLSYPVLGASMVAVPQYGDAVHLGLATCASATCHGAAAASSDGVVQGDEYTTWQTHDQHANAYQGLMGELGQKIAHNLGLGSAQTAKICLDCHADNVPEARRGPQFQLSDGVGCEACHGGAENWIQLHTVRDDATSYGRDQAAGLYPTADPEARGRLCLSCHLGDGNKFVTHRLMGAGHPRLTFELDTFTTIEPAHFQVDADYRTRKAAAGGGTGAAKTWAIGQGVALAQTLEDVIDPKLGGHGLFPELTFFDCHACHKPMSADRWRERASVGLGPGVVRFNDANLIMLRVAAEVVAPALGKDLDARGRALHRASQRSQSEWVAAARELHASTLSAIAAFKGREFSKADLRGLLDALVKEGERGEYIDYMAAEQTTMALGSILTAMIDQGAITAAERGPVEKVMADLYAAVDKDEQYRPSTQLAALRRLQAAAER